VIVVKITNINKTTTTPPKPLNIEKTTKNGVTNPDPGLGQVHKYGIVKHVNRIPTLKLH
jgi:hypothetical protein